MSSCFPGRVWLRGWRDVPAPAARLVCFAHAGGGASFFRRWAGHVTPGIDLRAVQYPGREDRLSEPFAESLTGMADAIATELRSLADAPVALFGHSLGAAVAYEVARRMPGAGAPALLVVSGRHAPHDPGRNVHRLSDDEIWAELRAVGGTSAELIDNEELRELLLPMVRADYRLSERYRPPPGPALACPVMACAGNHDSDVDLALLPGWAGLTTSSFTTRIFPGGHFYLLDHADALVAEICMQLLLTSGTGWLAAP